jgi:hypothetical protein
MIVNRCAHNHSLSQLQLRMRERSSFKRHVAPVAGNAEPCNDLIAIWQVGRSVYLNGDLNLSQVMIRLTKMLFSTKGTKM